jgi:hypothetical protein
LDLIQDIGIEWIELIEDEEVIRYKWKDIPLQEIVKDGEEEYSLNLGFEIKNIDGDFDNLDEQIDAASKIVWKQTFETEDDILKDPEAPTEELLDMIESIVKELQNTYSSLKFSREEKRFYFRWDSESLSELTGNMDTYQQQIKEWIENTGDDLPF